MLDRAHIHFNLIRCRLLRTLTQKAPYKAVPLAQRFLLRLSYQTVRFEPRTASPFRDNVSVSAELFAVGLRQATQSIEAFQSNGRPVDRLSVVPRRGAVVTV